MAAPSKKGGFPGVLHKGCVGCGDIVTNPAKVLANPGVTLFVGVYGTNADGTFVIPTIWAELGDVRYAADPSGDASTDSDLPVWAQIQAAIGKLEELGTADKSTPVTAINEVLETGGSGGTDPAEVERIVEEYLEKKSPAPGEDGFSPIAKVTQTTTGATISITDKDGTTTTTITNGKDGKDGADGQDGYTPQKNVDYFDGKDGATARTVHPSL